MYIDTHTHLQFNNYKKDRAEVIKHAHNSGVQRIIIIGINLNSSKEALKIADGYQEIYAVVGFHPHNAKEFKEGDSARLEKLANCKKIVALGEMGLDYHYDYSPRKIQQEVFRSQIQLAHQLGKPLVLHSREAGEEFIKILDEEEGGRMGGVVHCFSGTMAEAESLIAMGFHLGFTGIITYNKAAELREIAARIPVDRILVETDCPFLTPDPFRGKRNEPAHIPLIVKKIAEIRQITIEEMAAAIEENARRLFSLPENT